MLPKTTEARVLGKGTSVGANYREAYRARSKAEWSERAANDIDGTAEQGSGSESGDEHINLSRSPATHCVSWKRRVTGLIFSGEANLLTQEKLRNVRQECTELTSIFVTILKRSRENPS